MEGLTGSITFLNVMSFRVMLHGGEVLETVGRKLIFALFNSSSTARVTLEPRCPV
jgi:hypothetical protein